MKVKKLSKVSKTTTTKKKATLITKISALIKKLIK